MEPRAASQEDKRNDPAARLSTSFNTYASPEVRQKLGWLVDKASEWAGRDVVLLSRNDLLNTQNDAQITQFGGNLVASLHDVLPESRHGTLTTWKNATPANVRAALNDATLEQSPFATFLEKPTANVGGLCLITLPDLDDTKAFLGKAFAGDQTDTNRLPGDNEDWMAVVVAHEAVHCRMHLSGLAPTVDGKPETLREKFQRSHDQTLKQEIQADQHGFDHYKDAMKEGQDLDRAVLNSFRDLRAIDSLRGSRSILLGSLGNNHTSNLLLDAHLHDGDSHEGQGHHHGNLDVNQPETIVAISTAQNETAMMAHMTIGMAMGRAYVQSLPDQTLHLQMEGPAVNPEAGEDSFPKVVPQDFDSNPQRAGLLSGYVMAVEKPEALYAATRALQERGAFGSGTLQEAYAKQYIDAMEATSRQEHTPEREALVTFFHESLEDSNNGTKEMEAAIRNSIAQARTPAAPGLDENLMGDTAPETKKPADSGLAPGGASPF